MKVLFVGKYYPPSVGGIERYSELLCPGLQTQGVEVEVLAAAEGAGTPTTEEEIAGVPVHRVGSFGELQGVAMAPRMVSLMQQLAATADIVHLNFPNPLAEVAYAALRHRPPTVLTYHSDIYRQRLALWLYRPFLRRLLRGMRRIIATSDNYVATSPFLSPLADRCAVIPLPADLEGLRHNEEETASREVHGRYGRFVLFVGRLVYYKGVEHAIDAVEEVPGVTLVIVGDGPQRAALEARARESSASDRVFFTGRISESELRELYRACACFVLPSIARAEAFGAVLIEAMACGAPAISTELGTGTSWVNRDGETGFVVPPADSTALSQAIRRLLEDDDLRERMGRAALAWAQQFSVDAVAQRTLRVYEEALACGGGAE
jgi:glycosyltransferase involved in cell wall biosynthesis